MYTLQKHSRWYVYELIDGRSGEVFYVGKGCGARMHDHEKDAANGVRSRKAARICEILAAGSQVEKRQIAFFWDEQAAYDHETDHIEFFGLASLTNVLPGGQKAWERRRDERAARKPRKPFDVVDTVISMAGHFAYWLVHTNGGRDKVTLHFEGGDPRETKVRNEIAQLAWLKLYPEMWAKACASLADRPRLAQAFRSYGISLADAEAA